MQFASPYFLWLLAVIPLMVVYYVWRTRQGGASIKYRPSTVSPKHRAPYVITCGICLSRCAARPSRSSS